MKGTAAYAVGAAGFVEPWYWGWSYYQSWTMLCTSINNLKVEFWDFSHIVHINPCWIVHGRISSLQWERLHHCSGICIIPLPNASPVTNLYFISLQVGTNIPDYLQTVQNGGIKRQPYILMLGTRLNPSQFFVIIEGLALEQTSLLKAMDACFSAFYVLDLIYPLQCHTTWEFVQKFFYCLEGGKGKAVTSPSVRSLRTHLERTCDLWGY